MATDAGWNETYEAERAEQALWAALMAVPGWKRLELLAKARCKMLRDSRGMLQSDSDVAKYNFELGMLAGIEWVMQMPASESETADEQAAYALEMIRGEQDEKAA